MICSPSFLSCDFDRLESEIRSVSNAKWLHFDVMDGKFVTNTTYDHTMLKQIQAYSNQFFDCHLMIEKPSEFIQDYIESGAHSITFHIEAQPNPKQLIQTLKDQNIKVGMSVKPNTDIATLDPYLPDLDLILVMSVEPGKGGQRFLPSALDKISYLNQKRMENGYRYLIEVDGGINLDTAKLVEDHGCDVIVVGSFLFNQDDRNAMIEVLEDV
ncbi:MAG: ribulose-phosphate 3-epimerase [Bacilli bacterium]|nr:ribulose-phosphate 3-epimerase [Bacilli bacterium]MBN2877781.1 ribulose-phosphate 3-epimerase [Bacilli bacterium]